MNQFLRFWCGRKRTSRSSNKHFVDAGTLLKSLLLRAWRRLLRRRALLMVLPKKRPELRMDLLTFPNLGRPLRDLPRAGRSARARGNGVAEPPKRLWPLTFSVMSFVDIGC